MKLVANGDVQMGQSKQFLEHLPRSFALYHAQWHLEEAAWAVPTHYLLYGATWTSYLLAIFTV